MGSYDATLLSEPLFTKQYADYTDNIWLEVKFDQEYEDGEYLVDVVNISNANHVVFGYQRRKRHAEVLSWWVCIRGRCGTVCDWIHQNTKQKVWSIIRSWNIKERLYASLFPKEVIY